MSNILNKLNEAQKQAVLHQAGPMLIVAGAGTGKTTVLINRLAYLLEQGVAPDNILIVTFTDKAASELTERADKVLEEGYFDFWIETFHSLSERILRAYGLEVGLPTDYKLVTSVEAWILMKKNLDYFELDYFKPLGNPDKYISELLKHFGRLKDQNVWPAEYLAYVDKLKENNKSEETELDIKRYGELANAYDKYNKLLLENKLLDFGDLINYCLKLFIERPNIAKIYQEKFKYIMVDEFQDTNLAQYELIKILAKPDNSLMAVGDDDQSIYKFRGASLSNIMQFKDDYLDAKNTILVENYRSGQLILDKSYEFIKHNNPNRLEVCLNIDKKLLGKGNIAGATVEHWSLADEASETQAVVSRIQALQKDGLAGWADIAILVRANKEADRFVHEFEMRGIPNQFMSRKGLYFKPIIIDTLAFLKLLDNYHESVALFRVLSTQCFLLKHDDLMVFSHLARKKNWSLYEALQKAETISELSVEGRATALKLVKDITRFSEMAKTESISKILAFLIRDIAAVSLNKDEQIEEYRYLEQLYNKAKVLEEAIMGAKIKDFLEYTELEMAAGDTGSLPTFNEGADTVKIATVHSAKGLEFKYVFIVGLVEQRFPSGNHGEALAIPVALAKEKLPEGEMHLEEERRLFYVAMTRAKIGLVLTSARNTGGVRPKKPSRFISEAEVLTTIEDVKSVGTNLDMVVARLDDIAPKKIMYLTPDKFSFSQLESYNSCPLKYKFAHVLKIPTEDNSSLTFGSLMHAVVRDFLLPLTLEKQFNQEDLFTKENLLKIFENSWQEAGYNSKEQAAEYKKQAQEMLLKFWYNLEANGLPNVFSLELGFTYKIGGYILKGSIDRIDTAPDGSFKIVDYKTGHAKTKLEYKEKKQLLVYKLALEQLTGKKVSSLGYYYFESGELIEFEVKEKDLEKLQLEIIETIKAILSHDFSANPSELCKYCDFKGICEFRQL